MRFYNEMYFVRTGAYCVRATFTVYIGFSCTFMLHYSEISGLH